MTLQTAGEALNWNPHLHGLLADGTFGEDGEFDRFKNIDCEQIQKRFSELVLTDLSKQELIDDGVMSQVLSQEHSGFSFWCGDPFHDDESERFVARYVERGPISLEKLSIDEDLVSYTTREGKTYDFSALDFLALLTSHIPNTYESITRYYGWYSCRKRGERAKVAVKEPNDPEDAPEEPSSSWARCIKRVYEINPLECPRCKGEMRIVAFVQDPLEVKKIMKSLGIPDFRAPPPVPDPPEADEHCVDPFPNYDA